MDSKRLISDAAKNQVAMHPQNTVFDAKHLIGRKITNAEVIVDMKHFSFKVIDSGAGKPVVEVEYKGETKKFVSYMFAPLLEKRSSLLSCFRLLKKSPPWSSPR